VTGEDLEVEVFHFIVGAITRPAVYGHRMDSVITPVQWPSTWWRRSHRSRETCHETDSQFPDATDRDSFKRRSLLASIGRGPPQILARFTRKTDRSAVVSWVPTLGILSTQPWFPDGKQEGNGSARRHGRGVGGTRFAGGWARRLHEDKGGLSNRKLDGSAIGSGSSVL